MLKFDYNIIWTFVNILVLFLFLKKFLFKPVTEMMEKRKKLIQESLQNADEERAKALKLRNDYELELMQAGEQATAIMKEARERAEFEYSRKLLEAKEEASKMITEADKVIEMERKLSMEKAQSEIAGIALLAASKIVGKNIDENTNRQMLGDFLKDVGAAE